MVQYRIFYSRPHRHFISFEAKFPTRGQAQLRLQLPSWRPGRYELGNFAKNIRLWHAMDEYGNVLPFTKLSKDLWQVSCQGLSEVSIRYEYYASELNAGSSYMDDEQLYINPVNCFFYDEQKQEQPYRLEFFLPERFEIACGLPKESEHTLLAEGFDQLADSPLIVSDSLQHLLYDVNGITFHIYIQGKTDLEETRLLKDFHAFTASQLKIFQTIPCKEYYFLFQFVPYALRHGVEHHNSTVIAMGHASDLKQEAMYQDMLAISCHELFHTWNVKNIRPIEMMPYRFNQENYSSLGYVAEGVTTYYGDVLLWRSGILRDEEWLTILTSTINTHVANAGRFNLSVAESSFDTWLDGYTAGIPWRKVSIYNEGSLIAFICDAQLMRVTEGKKSLNDVMLLMYQRFGQNKIGYNEEDYWQLMEEVGGQSFRSFFDSIVRGTRDYLPFLIEALQVFGLQLESSYPSRYEECYLGMAIDTSSGKAMVKSVVENAPADIAQLWVGDVILSVNRWTIANNFGELMEMHEGRAELLVSTKGRLRKLHIAADGCKYNPVYKVIKSPQSTAQHVSWFDRWKTC